MDVAIECRDADAERKTDARSGNQNRHFLNAPADAFGDDFRIGRARARQQDHEFLAAVTP